MKLKIFSQVLIYSLLCISFTFSQTKDEGSKKSKKKTSTTKSTEEEPQKNKKKTSASQNQEENSSKTKTKKAVDDSEDLTEGNKKKGFVHHELDPKDEKKIADNYFLHESYKLALPLYL